MLNKAQMTEKVEGIRRIYGCIEEAQMQSIIEAKDTFKVVFDQKDKEVINSIAMNLGFDLHVCYIDDGKVEYMFS